MATRLRMNEKPAGVRLTAPNGSTVRVSEARAEALLAEVGWTKAKSQRAAAAPAAEEEDDESLDSMSVPELRQYAKDNDIDLGGATRKDDIITAIEAAESAE